MASDAEVKFLLLSDFLALYLLVCVCEERVHVCRGTGISEDSFSHLSPLPESRPPGSQEYLSPLIQLGFYALITSGQTFTLVCVHLTCLVSSSVGVYLL